LQVHLLRGIIRPAVLGKLHNMDIRLRRRCTNARAG
jgi:hypothetical protein